MKVACIVAISSNATLLCISGRELRMPYNQIFVALIFFSYSCARLAIHSLSFGFAKQLRRTQTWMMLG